MCRVQLSLRALHAFSVYTVSVKTALLAAWKTSQLSQILDLSVVVWRTGTMGTLASH